MALEKFMKIRETLLGVDIGYDSVKIVALRKGNGSHQLRSSNIVAIPPKSLQQKSADLDKIAGAINTARKTARPRISEKLTVSGLPESKVFTKIIQVPQMTDEELKTAVPNEAARHIPLAPEEIYLDWQKLGQSGKNSFDILVIAAPKFLVENYLALFKKVGLELIAIETKGIAASRSIIKKGEENTIIILDIGAEATGISIFDLGSIKFSYTIPHGGNTLTKSIAATLKMTNEEAEKLKRKIGFKKDEQPEVIQAMEPVMKDILEEIGNAIKFYESRTKPPRKIAEIRICGGAALTPNIAPYIAEASGKKTNIANPFINVVERSWRRLPKENILRFTTAVGLALREGY